MLAGAAEPISVVILVYSARWSSDFYNGSPCGSHISFISVAVLGSHWSDMTSPYVLLSQ